MLDVVTAGLILAAGLGTRLRPLSDYVAKPILPIGDRSALSHVAEAMRGCGAEPLVANAFFQAREVAHEARALGMLVSHEDELLGTAGGVRKAWSLLASEGDLPPLLIGTGDVLTRASFAPLLALGGAEGTLLIEPRDTGAGNVGVDRDGFIVRFRQETLREGEVSGGYSLGVQCLAPSMWAHLPTVGCLVADLYMPLIRNGARIRVCATTERWTDVGTLQQYLAANLEWLGSERAWVHPTAECSNTTLDQVIVGRGATLGPGSYRRCVVLPNACAIEPGEGRVYWADTFAEVLR